MFWLKVKEYAGVAWSALKKLPGWAIMAIFILIATCWYLLNLATNARSVAKIRKKQTVLEKEHHENLKQITEDESEKLEILEKNYQEKSKELDEARDDLMERASKGPVEIADAWKEFLGGRKK